jgi:NADH dehydrogenase FAD-containing subunit
VKVLTFTNVLEVTSKGVVVSDKNGNDNTLVADSIVLAVGLSPNNGLF